MTNQKYSFPPVVGKDPAILILGSMPGEESLRQQEYYGHPRNAFWAIMGEIFGFPRDCSYADRLQILKDNRIALWDVMQSCRRTGSLDSKIENSSVVPNDLAAFLKKHDTIKAVLFNGARAEKAFAQSILPDLEDRRDTVHLQRLPSTSPAMTMMTREQKLHEWKEAIGRIRD